jgi:hypothetical protein
LVFMQAVVMLPDFASAVKGGHRSLFCSRFNSGGMGEAGFAASSQRGV